MCSPTTCRRCGKTTWSGCGQHIADVKRRVPAGQWCDGAHEPAESGGGFFAKLFGRG